MSFVEVERNVFNKLKYLGEQKGITMNEIIKLFLKPKKIKLNRGSYQNIRNRITQDELIPYIVNILFNNGYQAPKQFVEKRIFETFEDEFKETYFQKTVSHGVPRWKHFIAWAKERARQRDGYIKSSIESGRGIWELTDEGILFVEKELVSLTIK